MGVRRGVSTTEIQLGRWRCYHNHTAQAKFSVQIEEDGFLTLCGKAYNGLVNVVGSFPVAGESCTRTRSDAD
jgi:hypothetical protein